MYPWLLSWVWRWNPPFPANLSNAVALNVLAGFVFLVASFLFFSQLHLLSDVEILALTAFCAWHPVVLFYTANIISDIPFAALSVSSIVLAGKAIRNERATVSVLSSGVLSGLSILLRVLGAPIAAGLWLAILLRQGWRKSIWFLAGVLPFAAGWLWSLVAARHSNTPLDTSSCASTWQGNWLYYTSYLGFWRADVLQNHVLWPVLKQNLTLSLLQPGMYFVEPQLVRHTLLTTAAVATLSAGAIRGLILKMPGQQHARIALALYALPLLFWDYPIMVRFLLPFVPLLFAGLWLEARALIPRVRAVLGHPSPKSEKVAAVFLSAVLVALLCGIGWSWWRGMRSIWDYSAGRGEILIDKREAYLWLRENTPANAKVIAYEDGAVYLYSGRQGMRPVIFLPAGLSRPTLLQSELACINEGARVISAHYWWMASDDFGFEWQPATTLGIQREQRLAANYPEVFRSSAGRVRVYQLP